MGAVFGSMEVVTLAFALACSQWIFNTDYGILAEASGAGVANAANGKLQVGPSEFGIGVDGSVVEQNTDTYEKPATEIPKQAQPKPEIQAISGTVSIPQAGSRPNAIATSNGTQP